MSTKLPTIKGRYEISGEGFEADHEKSELYITRFWGGDEAMIQLTPSHSSYIQLRREQVKELISILKNAFNYKKYPSD